MEEYVHTVLGKCLKFAKKNREIVGKFYEILKKFRRKLDENLGKF